MAGCPLQPLLWCWGLSEGTGSGYVGTSPVSEGGLDEWQRRCSVTRVSGQGNVRRQRPFLNDL